MDPKEIVAQGYDSMAEQHRRWAGRVRQEERARCTSLLLEQALVGGDVLELGCGAGPPTTRQLAERFAVTGVDISPRQVALARLNVPNAEFICADMTKLDLPSSSYDAVAAFYSLIHAPREEQAELLRNIAVWLRPGVLLVATFGAHDTKAGYEEDWLGAPMYWSSYDSETNVRLVEEAGLRIVSAREETAEEFGEPTTFLWVIARKYG